MFWIKTDLSCRSGNGQQESCCECELKGVQCQREEGEPKRPSLSHSKVWLFGAEPLSTSYEREGKKRANKLMGENTQQYPNATAVGFFRHHAHSAAEISSMLSVSFLLCFVCVHANIHTFKKGHFPISVVIPVAVIII